MPRLHYEPEVSQALGFGFRCGFLGLLHMEIVQERLEREFDHGLDHHRADGDLSKWCMRDGTMLMVENPSKMPDPSKIEEIREPIVTVNLYMPQEYVGCGDHAVHPEARHADQHAATTASR